MPYEMLHKEYEDIERERGLRPSSVPGEMLHKEYKDTHKHTHTHRERKRDRKRERAPARISPVPARQ